MSADGITQAKRLEDCYRLIADLSGCLTDEGPNLTDEGLESLRKRSADLLPPVWCPDWLQRYRTITPFRAREEDRDMSRNSWPDGGGFGERR